MQARSIFRAARAIVLGRQDLLAGGMTPRAIASAVRRGDLIRVRIGHYTLPGTDDGIVRAIRVGGLAAGVTATSAAGLWVPPRPRTHVWLPSNASRLRSPTGVHSPGPDGTVVRHWEQLDQESDPRRGTVGLIDALRQVVESESRLHAVAVLDNALSTGVITDAELSTMRRRLSPDLRPILGELDDRSGSGSESIVRLVLRDAGFAPRSQVAISGVGIVDFLVGRSVVVEVDSRAWHDAPHQRARDFERDLALYARGYVVIRVDYRQALFDHALIVRAVAAALVTVQV